MYKHTNIILMSIRSYFNESKGDISDDIVSQVHIREVNLELETL